MKEKKKRNKLFSLSRSRNKNSLREHMRIRHIQKPETCNICGKVSANKKALMKHKKFHFIEEREKFKCNSCGRGFRDSTKLRVSKLILLQTLDDIK